MTSRALVLGGGGNAGVAWECGIVLGLAEHGIDLGQADLVVGTSAGSIVAMMLRAGWVTREHLETILATDRAGTPEALSFDAAAFMSLLQNAGAGASDPQEARARLGRQAASLPVSLSEEAWVAQIAAMLPPDWPGRPVAITAVNADDGAFVVLSGAQDARVQDAVAASCAVPGVFPPVHLGGRPHMDGGMRSATNANVAAGHDRVLVLACSPEPPDSPFGPTLPQALARIEHDGQALVITLDASAVGGDGVNALDPASAAPAFAAGLAQAQATAQAVRSFWGD